LRSTLRTKMFPNLQRSESDELIKWKQIVSSWMWVMHDCEWRLWMTTVNDATCGYELQRLKIMIVNTTTVKWLWMVTTRWLWVTAWMIAVNDDLIDVVNEPV
jgi:hypothetical protein